LTYRTANLQSRILYIYSTNIGTEYFKHGIYSPFFFPSKCSLFHNSNVFDSCVIHILYTGCAKIIKKLRRQKVKEYHTLWCEAVMLVFPHRYYNKIQFVLRLTQLSVYFII